MLYSSEILTRNLLHPDLRGLQDKAMSEYHLRLNPYRHCRLVSDASAGLCLAVKLAASSWGVFLLRHHLTTNRSAQIRETMFGTIS